MRWLPAAALLVLASGCLEASGSLFAGPEMDCSQDLQMIDQGWAELLFPPETPGEAQQPFGEARLTVSAREGQTLSAVAVWGTTSGGVAVQFDGPPGNVVTAEDRWAYSGTATKAGEHSLELVGDPMAFGVGYALILAAIGCTPVE